jgi:urease accessory protein
MVAVAPRVLAPDGWRGRLALGLERRGTRTVVASREHVGPLVVQRPFYPESDGTCHLYLLHPPGGVVGGDRLETEVEVARGGAALVTTPAATKLYRSAGPLSLVSNQLTVQSGAALEWLPQETIAFGGSRTRLTTRVALEPDAVFLGWEVSCLGRPASGDGFASGELDQRFELTLAGRPLLVDRLHTEGGGSLQRGAWGWGGRTVYGCFVATGTPAGAVEAIRAALPPGRPGELLAVTRVGGVLVLRFLGHGAERARACLGVAWSLAREAVLGKPACAPRIWAT